jgi:hypothetical protein
MFLYLSVPSNVDDEAYKTNLQFQEPLSFQ